MVSVRHGGRSLPEIARDVVGARARLLFMLFVWFALILIIAVFGVVIAIVFDRFQGSVLAVWLQIPIAVTLGYMIYRRGANVVLATVVAVAGMYATIWLGSKLPLAMPVIMITWISGRRPLM